MGDTIYFVVLILSGIVSLVLFLYSVLRIRSKTIYFPLTFFALGIAAMSFSDAVYYKFFPIYHYKLAGLECFFINMVAISWLSIIIILTGYFKKKLKRIIITAILFSLTGYIGVLSNPLHHLFYRYSIVYFSSNDVYGPWFWYNTGINYLYIILGIAMVIKKNIGGVSKTNIILLIGVIIPLIFNILFVFNILKSNIDITSPALSVTAGVFLYIVILEKELERDILNPDFIINNVHIGFLAFSKNKVIAQNKAFGELLSVKDKFEKVSEIMQYFNNCTLNPSKRLVSAITLKNANIGDEIRIKKSGKIIRINVRSVYKGNVELGKIITLTDLSELKDIESLNVALKQMNAELAQQKEKQSRILGHLSHDLMTPITSIEGYIKYLLDGKLGKLNEKQWKALSVVDKNMLRLQKMLENVLLITKLETANDVYNKKLFDIKVLLIDIFEERNIFAVEKGFDFKLNINLKEKMIFGDRDKIHTIMDNLLDNAFKYTVPFGEIIMFAKNEDDNVIFGVKNRGKYIKKGDIERITEPFVRLKSVGNKKGVGLGLAIVKSIAKAHNGRFKVKSSKDGLNSFSVTIPQY